MTVGEKTKRVPPQAQEVQTQGRRLPVEGEGRTLPGRQVVVVPPTVGWGQRSAGVHVAPQVVLDPDVWVVPGVTTPRPGNPAVLAPPRPSRAPVVSRKGAEEDHGLVFTVVLVPVVLVGSRDGLRR